jgi:hypothetical protein
LNAPARFMRAGVFLGEGRVIAPLEIEAQL